MKNLTTRRWMPGAFVALLLSRNGLAQSDTSAVALSAVTVRAVAPERFLAGQKLQRVDSTTLLQFRFSSLTDVLTYTTPLAFKSYGPGQLTTVSFRGTSANHTAVLWNGININQPNLGQTDFSTLPTAGFDQLAVQYGSSASAIGSGAVGGSVLLGSSPVWQPGMMLTVGQQVASFQNNQTQVALRYAGRPGRRWQVAGKTVVYRNQFSNVYPYTERRHYFVDQSTTVQRGFLQDLYVRHRNGQQLTVNAWLSDNDLIQSPQDTIARKRTRTQSARLLTAYKTGQLTLRLGWTRDVLDYAEGNFDAPSHTLTDRFIGRAEREFALVVPTPNTQLILRVGGEWSHYRTRVDGYGGQLITENRQDLYALLRLQTTRWLVSANLRQAFVTRFSPPLTPSVGAEYRMVQRDRLSLTAKGAASRSYRVPTLNERYWLVLGNPDLRPERGLNLETGLTLRWVPADRLTLTTDLTAYRNRVDDWSYWNPDYGYRVENLQVVVARGIELNTALAWVRNGWRAGGRLGYAFTRSSQERAYNAYAGDLIGKQLPYVPVHTGTLNAYVARNQTRLTVQAQVNSRRFTTFDESQFMKGVALVNVLLAHEVTAGPVPIRVQGQVNNVFDALALSVRRTALPGRSVAVNVLINFTNKRHEKATN